MLEKIIEAYKKLLLIYQQLLSNRYKLEKTPTEKGQKIGEFVQKNIGKSFISDADFDGDVDDNDRIYGCAITVNNIAKLSIGEEIGGGGSTYKMYKELKKNKKRFFEVSTKNVMIGDIIISPTGFGGKGNGHVGFFSGLYSIASNNSDTGKLENNWDYESWCKYFKGRGFLVKIFRIK